MSDTETFFPPIDTTELMPRSEAEMTISGFEARISALEGAWKDRKTRLSTNSTGFWTRTYAVGFWTGEPSINVNPIAASAGAGQITWRTTKTLTAGAWKVDVQFTMLPVSISVLVLGSVNLGTSPGTVTFDYTAAEPNTA